MTLDRITLNECVFQCIVGILEPEQRAAQKLQVEIELGLDLQLAAQGELRHSVNYATVLEQTTFLAQQGRWGLLESLGMAVVRLLLARPAPQELRAQVEEARVRLFKPEVFGGRARPGIEITRNRSICTMQTIADGPVRIEVLQETSATGAYRVHILPGGDWAAPAGMALMIIAGNPLSERGQHSPGDTLACGSHHIHNPQSEPLSLLAVGQPPLRDHATLR